MVKTLTYGAETLRYEVHFSPRQTLSIEVYPDCRVLVRAPLGCAEELVAQRVQKRASWIARQVAEFGRYTPRTPARRYITGESHLYLGRQYRLKVGTGPTAAVELTRGHLLVTLPGSPEPTQVRQLLDRWYRDRAREVFAELLHSKLALFGGIRKPRLIVRSMQSRWGSLSSAGAMTLNVNLVRAPRPCIEYVIVHELCHARHRNHDKRYFSLLSRVMPDWVQRKRRLESALL